MSKLEEKLNKIHLQKMTETEKNSVWFSIASKQELRGNQKKLLGSFFSKKYMIATLVALVVMLGGGGVVAASNTAVPGDALYGIDQAVERIQIKLANDDKKAELKVKFAEERISEVEEIVQKGSANVRAIDLSGAVLTEVEVDVFTNETTVKIEADDKHYGFVTSETDQDAIIDEIKERYNLTDEQINAALSFETEDRVSRANDKDFLNSINSIAFKSDKQKQEFEGSITEVSDLVAGSDLTPEQKASLGATLAGVLALIQANPNLDIEFKTSDGFKLEVEDGKVEIKTNNGKGAEKGKSDDRGADVREDENEVFCRGEWRDPEDCTDDTDSDDDESDDNSDDSDDNDDSDDSDDDSEDDSDDESDSNDDDDSNDDEDDNDNSGSGSDDDEEDDDSEDDNDNDDDEDGDNSGSGSDDDDEDDN